MALEYKGYSIAGDGTYGFKEIKTIGAGSLPKSLVGSFTTAREAQKLIDTYVVQKELKNANTSRSRRSK